MLFKQEKPNSKTRYCLTILAGFCLILLGGNVFSQAMPPPPPPPPSPGEVFNHINPFKKKKNDSVQKKDSLKANTVRPAGLPPPPPPNPLDLFKKKKKDTVKTSSPDPKAKVGVR
ncbi:MAG TPA: hypothetical protein VGN20_19840 [Mucilaginibacter sp.]|jgi:hypothetical protein